MIEALSLPFFQRVLAARDAVRDERVGPGRLEGRPRRPPGAAIVNHRTDSSDIDALIEAVLTLGNKQSESHTYRETA